MSKIVVDDEQKVGIPREWPATTFKLQPPFIFLNIFLQRKRTFETWACTLLKCLKAT